MKKPHKYPKQDNPKAKAAELQRSWEALLSKHSKPLERGASSFGIKKSIKKPSKPVVVQPVNKPERDVRGMMGIAAKAPTKVYTGTEMIGIGVAHKSGLWPVFSVEQAQDLSKMRRG
jgi:hypothetical protein